LLAKDESRLKETEENYRKAMELDPTYANAYISLGNLLAKDENRLAEAEEMYRKAFEINPTYALAYNNLGILLAKDESRLEEAEENYRKAIKLDPTYANTYISLGILLAKDESRLKEAEESYRKAIESNPNDALAYNNLGNLLYKQGKIDEAKKIFQTSVGLDKGQVNSRISLAAIYKKQGDQKESEKYAEQAKALLKEDSYYNLACLNSVLDEKDESFKYLKLAIEKSSRYKSIAKTDPDLEWIRGDKRFWEIVGRDNE
jgi:tetratricopeptide (TPR) repeat protein